MPPQALEAVGFVWKPSTADAKWHACYHALRHWHSMHGTAQLPHDYDDPSQPGWFQAARWLKRQRELAGEGKLPPARVALLEGLGVALQHP